MRNTTYTMAAVLMGMAALATPAMAGDFNFRLGIGVNDQGTGVHLAIGNHHASVVRVQPVAVERVWVEPVYQTVSERVWIPTVETRYRDVPVIGPRGHVIEYRREAYTVETGHWATVDRQVLVTAGHWMTVTRPAVYPTRYAYRGGLHIALHDENHRDGYRGDGYPDGRHMKKAVQVNYKRR